MKLFCENNLLTGVVFNCFGTIFAEERERERERERDNKRK
jgi:hypothetical protein